MRTGRVVVFKNADNVFLLGQVTELNPAGGAKVQIAANTEPIDVATFSKVRDFKLEQQVTAAIGIPLGAESVPNPHKPSFEEAPVSAEAEDEGEDNENPSSDLEEDDEE